MNVTNKISQIKKKAENDILRISSVFPFQFFPDELIIDRQKVSIIRKKFFLSKKIFSILLEDIKIVKVQTGPIFANLRFEISGYEKNPRPVTYLRRWQAKLAKKLIETLIILNEEGINTSSLSNTELIKKSHAISAES